MPSNQNNINIMPMPTFPTLPIMPQIAPLSMPPLSAPATLSGPTRGVSSVSDTPGTALRMPDVGASNVSMQPPNSKPPPAPARARARRSSKNSRLARARKQGYHKYTGHGKFELDSDESDDITHQFRINASNNSIQFNVNAVNNSNQSNAANNSNVNSFNSNNNNLDQCNINNSNQSNADNIVSQLNISNLNESNGSNNLNLSNVSINNVINARISAACALEDKGYENSGLGADVEGKIDWDEGFFEANADNSHSGDRTANLEDTQQMGDGVMQIMGALDSLDELGRTGGQSRDQSVVLGGSVQMNDDGALYLADGGDTKEKLRWERRKESRKCHRKERRMEQLSIVF